MVGHIGRISDKDMERLEEEDVLSNYRGTDHIGKLGLEQSYEKQLHGITGFEQVETDAGGRAVRTLSRTPPISGDTLYLSIDSKLQQIAVKAFGQFRGALVAIEPKSGEVLAFVSQPGFDPNLFVDGIDAANWDAYNNSPDKPLNNRALRGQYPPGSTFKPFMALAGLELGKRTPSYTISDPGFYTLPGSSHHYRDWKAGGHGSVDLHKSIVISCDTYYYGLAVDLGIDNITNFMSHFGFGRKTGIDIEGEQHGRSAFAGMENEALQAEMVHRRHRQRRHRPGLQSGHPAATGGGDRGPGQQRPAHAAAPGAAASRTAKPARSASWRRKPATPGRSSRKIWNW